MTISRPSECKLKSDDLLFYAITDRRWAKERSLLAQVEEALRGGVTCLQYREKYLSPEACLAEGKDLRALCRRYQVPFIVNDHPDLARQLEADGVHLGPNDEDIAAARKDLGPGMIIGGSVRTVEDALAAERAGADYLGCGAVFTTATKNDARPLDHRLLRQICQAVTIPIVAIGGITADNLPQLKGLGLSGVALVSAVFSTEPITENSRKLLALIRQTIG